VQDNFVVQQIEHKPGLEISNYLHTVRGIPPTELVQPSKFQQTSNIFALSETENGHYQLKTCIQLDFYISTGNARLFANPFKR
jgi:hypothetical protein